MPVDRAAAGGRALWLRIEWNVINLEQLTGAIQRERRERGLRVDIPEVSAG